MSLQNREKENRPALSGLWRRLADVAADQLADMERRRAADPEYPCDLKSLKELTALLREATDLYQRLEASDSPALLQVQLEGEVAAWSR